MLALGGAPVIRLLEGRYGIARREWRLLAVLATRGALSPSALATQAHLDRPRTSRAISSMVEKGLLQRVPQPGDHRRAQVTLSAQGRQLFDEIFPQVAALNAELVAELGDELLQSLDTALTVLTKRAARLNAERVQDVHANRRAGGSRRLRSA